MKGSISDLPPYRANSCAIIVFFWFVFAQSARDKAIIDALLELDSQVLVEEKKRPDIARMLEEA